MVVDVDYLSRMHNSLIKSHVVIANRMSLADRAEQPATCSEDVLSIILSKGKYTIKFRDRYMFINAVNTVVTAQPIKKKISAV